MKETIFLSQFPLTVPFPKIFFNLDCFYNDSFFLRTWMFKLCFNITGNSIRPEQFSYATTPGTLSKTCPDVGGSLEE